MHVLLVVFVALSCGTVADGAQPVGRKLPVELGDLYCIGPLKDAALGIARIGFDMPFAPEQDVLRAGAGPIDLDTTYHALKFPGMLDTQRRWQRHPEWINGYRHLLPRGRRRLATSRSISTAPSIPVRRSLWTRYIGRRISFAFGLNGTPVVESVREKSFYGASKTAGEFPCPTGAPRWGEPAAGEAHQYAQRARIRLQYPAADRSQRSRRKRHRRGSPLRPRNGLRRSTCRTPLQDG